MVPKALAVFGHFPTICRGVVAGFVLATVLGGCVMPFRQAAPKDMRELRQGTKRTEVLAKFGRPISVTKNKSGMRVDVFKFVQMTMTGDDSQKPLVSGGDVTPLVTVMLPQDGALTVKALDGKTLTVRVVYDAGDVVADTFLLSATN